MHTSSQHPEALYNAARSHPVLINNIPPEPDMGFHALPIADRGLAEKFALAGMFEKTGYCNGNHPNCDNTEWRCKARTWTLTENGKKVIEAIDEPDTLPCNHQGLHTVTAGSEYTCMNESCDETFSRDVAESVRF